MTWLIILGNLRLILLARSQKKGGIQNSDSGANTSALVLGVAMPRYLHMGAQIVAWFTYYGPQDLKVSGVFMEQAWVFRGIDCEGRKSEETNYDSLRPTLVCSRECPRPSKSSPLQVALDSKYAAGRSGATPLSHRPVEDSSQN